MFKMKEDNAQTVIDARNLIVSKNLSCEIEEIPKTFPKRFIRFEVSSYIRSDMNMKVFLDHGP